MRRQLAKFLGALLVPSLLWIGAAKADEITIQDTSGFTRAVSAVDGTGVVEFAVVDSAGAAADGAAITLTNAVTGEVLTATASNGAVTFGAVGPGVWTVATSVPGITFTSASIAATAAVAGGGGLLAAGTGAAVIGGGGAAAVGIASANNSSSDELSPAS